MAVWNKPVSWSKFRLALECPRQLQYTIDNTPVSVIQRGWYAGMGTAVQKVFELFYNRGLWEKPVTRTPAILKEVARRVLLAGAYDEGIIYDDTLSKEKLEQEVYSQVESGRQVLEGAGLLGVGLTSEKGWGATFRSLRLFGMVDFLRFRADGSMSLYDGKGSQRKNADPRQILYYALILLASGKRVADAAIVYWKHGIEYVDVSPGAIQEFVENDFIRGEEVFQKLKAGVAELPAVPNKKNCGWCSWRRSCPESPYHQSDLKLEGLVSLGDTDGE